jgi:hypothetical protein
MYGIKPDVDKGTFEILEGEKTELDAKGCIVFCKDEGALNRGIINAKYYIKRAQFNHLSIEQLEAKSEETLQLEKKVFGVMEDYKPGKYIDGRIKRLKELEKGSAH